MAVTLRNVLDLEIMRKFKVIAGEKGLSKTISLVEILDFEFMTEGKKYREKIFDGDSIVLSSLMFAKDSPALLLDAVQQLHGFNVKCLAYKPVFFQGMPQEVIDFANQHDFVILEFGHDEYFEPIITSINELVEKDRSAGLTESLLEEMLMRKFSPEEADAARDSINPFLRPEGVAVCMKVDDVDEEDVREIIRRARPDSRLASKTYVGKCKDKLMIILSQDEQNPSRFKAQLDDVLIAYGLMDKTYTLGVSNMRHIKDGFDRMIHQAYWAEIVAELEKVKVHFYQNLGVYKLIISDIHSFSMVEYMENYLGPLFDDEEKDHELLHTAVEYILAKGDTLKTAEQLFCHKNTIRYRIGKLQEKLDPRSNEKEFYQNLAMAIKIYLLLKKNK